MSSRNREARILGEISSRIVTRVLLESVTVSYNLQRMSVDEGGSCR